MPVTALAARATDAPKPTSERGSSNPAVIVCPTRYDNFKYDLTRNTGHRHRCRSHFYIDCTLRLRRKTTASQLFHQPSQEFQMAVLDQQGQTAAPFHQEVGH